MNIMTVLSYHLVIGSVDTVMDRVVLVLKTVSFGVILSQKA